jgi:hypothetical protein
MSKPTKGERKNPQARTTHIPVLSSLLDKLTTLVTQKAKGMITAITETSRMIKAVFVLNILAFCLLSYFIFEKGAVASIIP